MRFQCRIPVWMLLVLGVSELVSVAGCTTSRGLYETRQRDARNECFQIPSGIERDKCLERNSQSFDEYTREREKAQQADD